MLNKSTKILLSIYFYKFSLCWSAEKYSCIFKKKTWWCYPQKCQQTSKLKWIKDPTSIFSIAIHIRTIDDNLVQDIFGSINEFIFRALRRIDRVIYDPHTLQVCSDAILKYDNKSCVMFKISVTPLMKSPQYEMILLFTKTENWGYIPAPCSRCSYSVGRLSCLHMIELCGILYLTRTNSTLTFDKLCNLIPPPL